MFVEFLNIKRIGKGDLKRRKFYKKLCLTNIQSQKDVLR